ncbi:MAG: terminase [Flavobacteriales bacterium]|nr:terminase [Flavobacteriales bacterium]
MHRPDHTDFVAHFTKGTDPMANIVAMLNDRQINAATLPWTNSPAVCFTECPWSSLIDHAAKYSPYGLGFSKAHVFAAGGGPVYYVRPDHFEKQQWDGHLKTFTTPFWPAYRGANLRTDEHLKGKTIDYSFEREWRVPHHFTFDPAKLEFVILNTYEDMARFPRELKDAIGRDKFILMDMYRKIEELWPTHLLSR